MPKRPGAVSETWTYLGRAYSGGKTYHSWYPGPSAEFDLDKLHGELFSFSKLKATAIGGDYLVDVVRDDDGNFKSVYTDVRYTGNYHSGDPEVRAVLVARDQDARRRKTASDTEKRLQNSEELESRLEDLRPLVSATRTYDDLEVLVRVVGRRMHRMWDEERLSQAHRQTQELRGMVKSIQRSQADLDKDLDAAISQVRDLGGTVPRLRTRLPDE